MLCSMLWWSGQNFLDVAPYIADAPVRVLPLLSHDVDSHDWWNLLRMTDSLESAGSLAALCFALGVGVLLLSNVWGGFLLYVEFRGRTDPEFLRSQKNSAH
jgi:ABC-type nitrate/sulfonate/bicarbonate transport system permease component